MNIYEYICIIIKFNLWKILYVSEGAKICGTYFKRSEQYLKREHTAKFGECLGQRALWIMLVLQAEMAFIYQRIQRLSSLITRHVKKK